jgi:dipeptidyl aminopeptidase/acylaminoacyl peptidase
VELAANLKGNLLLETGDMDNNVHPANTIRLVQALIKANKRFDFMMLPGKPHAYGDMTPYTNHLMFEYFAEHLLGDYYRKDAIIKK